MYNYKKSNILFFCVIVFIITVCLEFYFPEYIFFDGGLLTLIVMTIFLKEDHYTYLFGIASFLLVFVTFFQHSNLAATQVMLQHLFSMLLIAGTVLLVLYVKKLTRERESEEHQINALFYNSTEGIVLADQTGKMILVNPAAEKMFGYDKNELLSKSVEILIPKRFTVNHEKFRNNFNESPQSRRMGHGRDLFGKRKDGVEIPVEISLSYYYQKKGIYVIAFIIDITVRKEAEKKLLEQKEQLEKITDDVRRLNIELENKVEERTLILKEALQELEKSQQELSEALDKEKELSEIKSRFVSMASHEFRTPLSTVLSSASILSKYSLTEDQGKRERHIAKIKDSVKHLNELLEDFLSLGKLEEGKITTEFTQFDIKDFLQDVVDEMKTIKKPGQEIILTLSDNLIFSTDKRLLKNILINLIGNAIKFSKENSPIWITPAIVGDKLEIAVKDEGIGISKEDQQHLFSSFFRGKNAENIQGTGLGLHIVSRYLNLIYGDVKIDSDLGKGTTITIILPFMKNERYA
ncbi:MAG TPA: PAS domain-containing sensor histidine kinase [Chitinophagaceae bacterium]|nr:PAS domain-containing sensor histidine kinase [Chitinophagaceae bacterium]